MKNITSPRCPVCGVLADSTGKCTTICPVCGFPYAFIKYFADGDDAKAWRDQAEKYKREMVERICRKQFAQRTLSLGDRAAAVITSGSQFLFCSDSNPGNILTSVAQISFGGRHCLLLFYDGHVETRLTSGRSADQGQCRVEDWSDIVFVEAGLNCSYGVRKGGTMLVSGIPPVPSEDLIGLKDLKTVTEGDGFVVCLTVSGQLRMIIPAGANQDLKNMQKAVESCQKVMYVEATKGCVIALDEQRNVHSFCVESSDLRLGAGAWTDVVMVAVDSHYAVGLTTKGRIRLAGRESFMDAGRKDASTWADNIAVACAPSGIGAISLDGTLRLAGNIIGAEKLKESYQALAPRIATAIIRQEPIQ